MTPADAPYVPVESGVAPAFVRPEGFKPKPDQAGTEKRVDRTQDDLIRGLVQDGTLRDARVEAALRAIPRRLFVPPEALAEVHEDHPLPIGAGQTISAPHMVAMMASALDVQPGHRVLEIGGGSGYHAAILAQLALPGGRVTSIEILPELARAARLNLARLPQRLPIEVIEGDGSRGHPAGAPYDRISVACAAPAVPPPLLHQLAKDGILVIPVGADDMQELWRIHEDGRREPLGPVRFVPLVGEHGFR